jgi:hypothetical protein
MAVAVEASMQLVEPRHRTEVAKDNTAIPAIGKASSVIADTREEVTADPRAGHDPVPEKLAQALSAGATCDQLGAMLEGATATDTLLRSLPIASLPSFALAAAPRTEAGIAWLARVADWAPEPGLLHRAAQLACQVRIPARALFDALARHPSQDPAVLYALRTQLVHLVPGFEIDPKVGDREWRTTGRLADALVRALAEPALLAQIDRSRMQAIGKHKDDKGQDIYSEDLSDGMSLERRLLRLEDMRGVLGINIDPANMALQFHIDWRRGGADELQRIADQGYRVLRLSLTVPVEDKDLSKLADFFRQLAAYNARQVHPSQHLRLMIVAGVRGSMDGDIYHLGEAERQGKGSVAAVGRAFGRDAAAMLRKLIGEFGLEGAIAGVELGNEPEAQWHTKGVKFDEAQRDSELGTAAVASFDQAAAGTGVTGLAAAHEWDPASEQKLIWQVYEQARHGLTADAVDQLVRASQWARTIDVYAQANAGTPKQRKTLPLAIHLYNSPFLARSAIRTLADIAAKHQLSFAISITELQIDSYSKQHPGVDAHRRLAAGAIDLGTQVMDEAAHHATFVHITNLMLFSWHHVSNVKHQDFGLRDNPYLTGLLGRR